jgi:hypothetical protein
VVRVAPPRAASPTVAHVAGLRHHLSLHARLLDERLVLSDPAG